MPEAIQVMIVDDHPMMRQGIRALLEHETDLRVVAEAINGLEGIQKARQFQPDVILMDLQLPVMSGLDAIRAIHAELPETKILVFTNYSEDKTIGSAVEAGAFGYLLKIDSTDKIIQAIRDAVHGISTLSHSAGAALLTYVQQKKHSSRNIVRLTRREESVLKMMAHGMTNEEIATNCVVSETTVRTHISHILSKLNLTNRAQAVIYAVRNGIVNLNDPAN